MSLSQDEEFDLIERYNLGKLTQEEIDAFEVYLKANPESRKRVRSFLRLDSYLLTKSQSNRELEEEEIPLGTESIKKAEPIFPIFKSLSIAATILISFLGFYLWQMNKSHTVDPNLFRSDDESTLNGYAVIKHLVDEKFISPKDNHQVGDLVSGETLEIERGLIQLDFFCGASVVIQGPAKFEVVSAWDAIFHSGQLRAVVPPAARGFKIKTAQGEIEDLGTEFSLTVAENKSQVHVIDGKVLVHSDDEPTQEMNTGDRLKLTSAGYTEVDPDINIAGLDEIKSSSLGLKQASFDRWKNEQSNWIGDQRLVAYFPMDEKSWEGNRILNQSPHREGPPKDAVMLGFATKSPGRFHHHKMALDVRRPDARARVFIDGKFEAYTFYIWVRIDSLSNWYNALFMGDNYNNGEPHWQINNEGKLMMSVMINEKNREINKPSHRIYYSPSFWNDELSGKWIQLASTYDPKNRVVKNYLNGEEISSEPIIDKFYIEKLSIGGAEIGSWGLPFKAEDSTFSLRNLNGRIDELMIFNAALSGNEIKRLYQNGKP